MQTPLIFKLLLLLAVSLRLIKSEKRVSRKKSENYYLLNSQQSTIQPITLTLNKPIDSEDLIKYCYRKQIRENGRTQAFEMLSLAEQLIYLAYQFNKFYRKGGLFRFLWHGNSWMIAFGQSLKYVDETWDKVYKKLIQEIAFEENAEFAYESVNWSIICPFPEGQKEYNALLEFENRFDLEKYLNAIVKLSIKLV